MKAPSPSSSEKNTGFSMPNAFQARITDRLSTLPYWAIVVLLLGVLIVWNVQVNEDYQEAFSKIVVGLSVTLQVTLVAYFFSIILGLITALGQLSKNAFWRNLAQFYVQIIRGVPIIVQIFYVALVLVPAAVTGINWLGQTNLVTTLLGEANALASLGVRDISYVTRGIIALAISYGAFSSEIFRAGIQSVERGQIEAAQALGLNWFQSFRFIIFPQAFRRILPPLGNDFIAMLKESSLVSVIGVEEITQMGKKYTNASFKFAETYNTMAYLYLSMTLILSAGVRYLERKMNADQQR